MFNAVNRFNRNIAGFLAVISLLVIMPFLSGCSPEDDLVGYNLVASDDGQATDFPRLQPLSFFNVAHTRPAGTDNITARANLLRRKIAQLSRPVISAADRSRLEAAIARHSTGL